MKENKRLFKHYFMLIWMHPPKVIFIFILVYTIGIRFYIDYYHVPKFHIFIGLYVNLHTYIRRQSDVFSRAILVNVIETEIKHCNISAFV